MWKRSLFPKAEIKEGHIGKDVAVDHWIAENSAIQLPRLGLIHRYWTSRNHSSKVQLGQGWETGFWDTCETHWEAVNQDATET